jgi:heptosyltransferase II
LNRILIIQTASIGDVILVTPLMEKLHAFHPGARIDLLIKRGCEGLFAGHPYIDTLFLWNKSHRKYRNLLHLLGKVRTKRYDLVVNVQRFSSTGIFTALSGASLKVGFDKNPFSIFYSRRIKHEIGKPGAAIHEVDRNIRLIAEFTDQQSVKPRLYPSQHDYARMSQFKTSSYICIAPASLWYTKQYPTDKWIEFVRKLGPEMYVYLLGSKADYPLCELIINESAHPNCFNFAGKLTLLESAALLRDATMNYVNDSAPMHLASAVNAKTTVIYCSTVPEFGFGPLSDDAAVVQSDEKLTCRPCGIHGLSKCPEKHFKCALNISTDKLLSRL